MRTPHIPREVVEWLRELFPSETPDNPLTHAEYLVLTGRRQVVKRLERALAEQEKNVLNASS